MPNLSTEFPPVRGLSVSVTKEYTLYLYRQVPVYDWRYCNNWVLFQILWNIFSASRRYGMVCSRVDRGSLVLRYSAYHFPSDSSGIVCWVAELNAALYPCIEEP